MLKAPCVQELELELGCCLWADVDSWPRRWSALSTPTLNPCTGPAGSDLTVCEEQIEGANLGRVKMGKVGMGQEGQSSPQRAVGWNNSLAVLLRNL